MLLLWWVPYLDFHKLMFGEEDLFFYSVRLVWGSAGLGQRLVFISVRWYFQSHYFYWSIACDAIMILYIVWAYYSVIFYLISCQFSTFIIWSDIPFYHHFKRYSTNVERFCPLSLLRVCIIIIRLWYLLCYMNQWTVFIPCHNSIYYNCTNLCTIFEEHHHCRKMFPFFVILLYHFHVIYILVIWMISTIHHNISIIWTKFSEIKIFIILATIRWVRRREGWNISSFIYDKISLRCISVSFLFLLLLFCWSGILGHTRWTIPFEVRTSILLFASFLTFYSLWNFENSYLKSNLSVLIKFLAFCFLVALKIMPHDISIILITYLHLLP